MPVLQPGRFADEHDVVVRVDDARDHGGPAQVDHLDARTAVDVPADLDEAPVLDQHFLHHPVLRVHGVDAPVHQRERIRSPGLARVAIVVAILGAGQRGQRERRHEQRRADQVSLPCHHRRLPYDCAS